MKRFKNPVYLSIIVGITLAFLFSLSTNAQQIERSGKVFVQRVDSTKSQGTWVETEYTYIDAKGNQYPICLSSRGSAFIWKVSKKTGKKYRIYLKEVTEQLKKEK